MIIDPDERKYKVHHSTHLLLHHHLPLTSYIYPLKWSFLVTVSLSALYIDITLTPSTSVDADAVIEQVKEHPFKKHFGDHSRSVLHQTWARDEDAATIPKYQIPDVGIPSRSAYQLLHDEMNLDGNPTLNLASFVHTWMPEEATKLIMETINK